MLGDGFRRIKAKTNLRGMAHEVERSKEVGGDSRNQHAKDPAQRKKWKNNQRGEVRENGKIEDSLCVYESQILRLAAVCGARRHRNHEVGNRQFLRANRDTQVDANAHGLAGAQVKMSCVNQEAGSARMLRRQGWEGTWGRQRRDSGFTDGNI